MTVRNLIIYPDPKLSEQSAHVRDINDEVKALAADLLETMKQHNGAGLAAIQVGVPLRMFAICGAPPVIVGEKPGDPFVMVNPLWLQSMGTGKRLLNEGCLSFPGVEEVVERCEQVLATWTDLDGQTHTEVFTGLQAQVVQHETEHLDGHTFLDKMDIIHRDRVRMKLKKNRRAGPREQRKMKAFIKAIKSGKIRQWRQP
jgi:peptide deformylase